MRNTSTLVYFLLVLVSGALMGLTQAEIHRMGYDPLGAHLPLLIVLILVGESVLFGLASLVLIWRMRYWLLALVLGLAGASLLLFAVFSHNQSGLLHDEGVSATAVAYHRIHHITNHYVDMIYTGKTDAYTVDYNYLANNRTYSSQNVEVSHETFDRLGTNTQLPIKYLPNKPQTNEVDLPSEVPLHDHAPWIKGFLAFGCLIMAYIFLNKAQIPGQQAVPTRPTTYNPQIRGLRRRSL